MGVTDLTLDLTDPLGVQLQEFRPGIVPVYGFQEDLDTGDVPITVWPDKSLYPFPLAAETLSITSTSASDDGPSGVGARTLRIVGLNASGFLQVEDVELNGLSPAVTTNSFLRVLRAAVVVAGTSKANVGTISMKNVTGNLLGVIPPLLSLTQQATYTVPANFPGARIIQFTVDASKTGSSIVDFTLRLDPLGASGVAGTPSARAAGLSGNSDAANSGITFRKGVSVAPLTDIAVEAVNVTNNNTAIGALFEVMLLQSGE